MDGNGHGGCRKCSITKILKVPMKNSSKLLRSATGQILELAGEANVKVKIKGMKKWKKITLQKGNVPPYLVGIVGT